MKVTIFLVALAYVIQGNAAQNIDITLSRLAPYEAVIWDGSDPSQAESAKQFVLKPNGAGALISRNFVLTVTTRSRIPVGGMSVTLGRADLWKGLNTTHFHDVIRIIRFNNTDSLIPELALYEINPPAQCDRLKLYPIAISPNTTLHGQICNISVWRIADSLLYSGPTSILDDDNHCKEGDSFFCTLDFPKDQFYVWDGGLAVCNDHLSGLYTSHISPISDPKRRGYFDVEPYRAWIHKTVPDVSGAGTLSLSVVAVVVLAVTSFA